MKNTMIRLIALSYILLLISTLDLNAQADNDVLMTVGNADVTVEEFKYIYEKNNGDQANYSQESLDEYLELYKKFKLKVQEAKAMKLDTIKALQDELAGYRSQLATSFLADKEILGAVVDEIHERKKTDVEVQHILVKVNTKAANDKKLAAEETIKKIKSEYRNGQSFEKLAAKYSEDKNTQRNGGNLGYTTAMLPSGFYELENVLYNAKIGEVTGPVWSKLGCHLIKVKSRRPARGVVKVAHILVKPEKNTPAAKKAAKTKADEIYATLSKGGAWSTTVQKESDDEKTKNKGGELPIFGISTYEKSFEDAAFMLEKVGDISAPVETKSGYHIIKLVEKVAPETKDDIKKRLKDKIKNYDRYKAVESQLIDDIKQQAKYQANDAALRSFAQKQSEEFYSYRWQPKEVPTTELLKLGESIYSVSDFAAYCKKNTRLRSQFDKEKPVTEAVDEIYESYVRDLTISYAEANLEQKYPSFRSLMREYEEGILLFEATKMSVWDKANQDTVGLMAFHKANESNYRHEKRAVVGVYTAKTTDEKQLEKITKCAAKHDSEKTLKKFNKKNSDLLSYVEKTVELDDALMANLSTTPGSVSAVEKSKDGDVSTFRKVESIEEPRNKTIDEARGYIVADYQDELESKWVVKLRKTYPINVNKKIYQQLIK